MTPEIIKLLIGTDRDGLAEALKLHGYVIREANEWRPLADHVIALIEMALKNRANLNLSTDVVSCEACGNLHECPRCASAIWKSRGDKLNYCRVHCSACGWSAKVEGTKGRGP